MKKLEQSPTMPEDNDQEDEDDQKLCHNQRESRKKIKYNDASRRSNLLKLPLEAKIEEAFEESQEDQLNNLTEIVLFEEEFDKIIINDVSLSTNDSEIVIDVLHDLYQITTQAYQNWFTSTIEVFNHEVSVKIQKFYRNGPSENLNRTQIELKDSIQIQVEDHNITYHVPAPNSRKAWFVGYLLVLREVSFDIFHFKMENSIFILDYIRAMNYHLRNNKREQ